ncbi:enoyl-CoA hydratase/isomerase family protein [Plantactinospora sp. S1510]|uniref:Enoyl-CoA hydratase/isomerase family protein n=1 Tax=Plantactinospora alkalitolerans TaxID=2789879 RepID=A0ABS0GR09_9ACTN|nr:enoyl-CoA hydratase-related protein [Plantactinospora alkalitolerans]MBF9128631.1 enoyl-CoA hydratase/isomerase family protein [Plantactinospora alkalitolerans]
MTESLLIDRSDSVVTLTLNRPAAMNALDVSLKEALRDTLAELEQDRSCRAVVLAGAGAAFCTGQDLREHAATLEAGNTDPLGTVRTHYNPIAARLASLPKPVVAAVRGMAAGAGASLAFLADFRIGGPGTSFLLAFAKVGLAGDTGASWSLPRLVGHAKAVELLMLAEPVGADEAHRLGLLNRLVDDELVLSTAQELAVRLAAGPTVAYGAIKRQLSVGDAGTLSEALAAEAQAQAICGATADHRAATAAFVAKRRAAFEGR